MLWSRAFFEDNMVSSSVEWTDCPNISQSSPCAIFQIEYGSKLPFHLYLLRHSRSSVPLVGLLLPEHGMNFYISRPLLIFLVAGSNYNALLDIGHSYTSLYIQIHLIFSLFNWHTPSFPKENQPILILCYITIYIYSCIIVFFSLFYPFLHSLYVYGLAMY